MRVKSSVIVRAPRPRVWETLSDPDRYLDFMSGITRWELEDGKPGKLELGSRIRMLIRVGAAEIGGLIEIVELKECSDMAWSSVTGVDQRGRWRLREAGPGHTRVELRYSYGVAGGGLGGLVAERVAAPILRRRLDQSLHALKRTVERDQQRRGTKSRKRSASPA